MTTSGSIPLETYRRVFAEEIAAVANLQTPGLVDAIARVPRERFLGEPPWKVFRFDGLPGGGGTYQDIANGDPRHVCHNIVVALDAARGINNGQPSLLTSWIDALAIARGDHVVHIGCGTGYYTAIMAELAGPTGRVRAYEVDPRLAERAVDVLSSAANVAVHMGDATEECEATDAMLINAGVSTFREQWLDAVRDNGRVLLPLTFSATGDSVGTGVSVLLTRRGEGFDARILGATQIYSCAVARDPAANIAVQKALTKGRWREVKTLRRDVHEQTDLCWCHLPSGCLSLT